MQVKFEIIEYTVPANVLSYLYNGDGSSLSDVEFEIIQQFETTLPQGHWGSPVFGIGSEEEDQERYDYEGHDAFIYPSDDNDVCPTEVPIQVIDLEYLMVVK